MSIYNPKTNFNPTRSGFDLTFRNTFSTCGGQLLPVCNVFCQPGDKFRLNLAHLTNAENLNKAAFARLEEHYDVFFVPVRQLWSYFPEFITQTNEPTRMGHVTWTNAASGKVPSALPYFSARSFANHVDNLAGLPTTYKDELGFPLSEGIEKLCDYLGYSKKLVEYYTTEQENVDAELNPFFALAYQKIYNDFYRDANWERPSVGSFNVDDYDDSSSSNPLLISNMSRLENIFKLRYVNLKKDYFTGLRPSQTYGDVSVVSSPVNTSIIFNGTQSNVFAAGSSPGASGVLSGEVYAGNTTSKYADIVSNLSMLELRKAQALQRWKDVTLSNRKDYASQIEAHFGQKVRQPFSNTVQFVGGFTSNMNIEQVTSTNANFGDVDNSLQVARGGSLNGFDSTNNTLEFETKDEYGYFMVIYYVLPLPDISAFGFNKFNLKRKAEDFFIPEFENLGLQTVENYELDIARIYGQGATLQYPLGYSNRYLEYKANYDVVHDEFVLGGSREQFVVTFNPQNVGAVDTDYTYFKANPHMLDNIFAIPYDGYRNTENFRNTTYINLKSIRNMSVDGMPY